MSGKVNLSYASPRRSVGKHHPPQDAGSNTNTEHKPRLNRPEPITLYSILSRVIEHRTQAQSSTFKYSQIESNYLHDHGYTHLDVSEWANSLRTSSSKKAAFIFQRENTAPPLFMLNLFLRRRTIRASSLGVAMRHLERRAETAEIGWSQLKLFMIRLLRHARQVWPESIPWIAAFFTRRAPQLQADQEDSTKISPNTLSDITHFCNTLLSLLSLPTSQHPIMYAVQQEKAQFNMLRYMANCSPAITVSRVGFRALARNQLAHPKTPQEKDWAELKGSSWPPWKVARTAMDEDKDYKYGVSRASQVLHRMFEAGHPRRTWEDVAQIYAGWDIDISPTIQTRTSLPMFSSQYGGGNHGDEKSLQPILWAGRIRATRTRREAWAAFLSHEGNEGIAHDQVYLAMFEKLFYPEAKRATQHDYSSNFNNDSEVEQMASDLVPGDMKEVLPDPGSPLHHIYLTEPVPSYKGLFLRMFSKQVHPSGRLLAFILETVPEFELGISALQLAKNDYNGAIDQLVNCQHVKDTSMGTLPEHLFTIFLRFLCRFGHYTGRAATTATFRSPQEHSDHFHGGSTYLFEYAHALLKFYRPRYRNAWNVFAHKLLPSKKSHIESHPPRYKTLCDIIDLMDEVDLDVDDEMFKILCTVTAYAVQTAESTSPGSQQRPLVLETGAIRLRTTFNDMVGTSAETLEPSPQSNHHRNVPAHIPGPAELHAYVRALGALRDYEGLYSFATWLAKHRENVTARAKTQRSGSRLLFRTLVAIRVAVEGPDGECGAPEEVAQLIRAQVESVEEWGGWPDREHVDSYKKGAPKSAMPGVGGR